MKKSYLISFIFLKLITNFILNKPVHTKEVGATDEKDRAKVLPEVVENRFL